MSTARSTLRMRVLAATLLLAAMLVGSEALLRVIRFAGPTGMFYVRDSVVGHRLRPGFKGWFSIEGRAFFTVNSDGMPDAERTVSKPAGTFRVAVVGDSFTEAAGVPREQRFAAVIERHLAACAALGGARIEVLSFGASGFGTGHELLEIRSHVWQYSPDALLLQLFAGNDLRNNVRELSGAVPAPFFVEGAANTFDLDEQSRALSGPLRAGWRLKLESTAYNWFRTLHLVQAARVKWRSMRDTAFAAAIDAADTNTTFGFEAGADWQIFVPPQTSAWEQAWRVTEGLLVRMQREADARRVAFHAFAVPSGIQVHPEKARREAFRAKVGAASLSYPGERLTQIADRWRIPLLDLAPPMLHHAERHQTLLYGHRSAVPGLGHWNVAGHRVAGEAIAHWLCQRLERSQRAAASGA